MGKTLLIAALLLATAPAYAYTVTICDKHGEGAASDTHCETVEKIPTEEDVAAAHHMFHFWERRQTWRAEHCGNVDEWGQLTGPSKTAPIGMAKYEFDQCQKPY